ncbi:MAG: hypothetical protein H0V82_08615 [Candidatus Protochlamydia sp.]|nr:hypothetical protein [Candidatus Protochlamydia sp.]
MILKLIQEILEKENFDCSILPSTESIPLEILLVSAGLDPNQKEKVIHITALPQQMEGVNTNLAQNEKYFRVQFSTTLPFEAIPSSLAQTASLILFLNQLLDWPGFELNELTNTVSYRYAWLTKESNVDSYQILSLIGSLLLSIEMFGDTIGQIASGRSTFNELLASIVDFGDKINKNNS